jgi:1-deoxy-D-xylulose-5-phosphate synthase
MFGTSFINRGLIRFRDFMKRVINKSNHFENYGFKYVGVIDGNDVKTMVSILNRVKEVAKEKAVFLHIKTTKGKGHKNAEEHADLYNGVGVNLKCESGDFATALGEKLNEFISEDKSVVALTAGMKDGTGLNIVEKENAKNFYDVGIAEELAVTMAAGMAAGGLKPYVAVYSTFMQRAYDQIIHDVCLQNLPVTICLDRAGLVGKDGKTHQGVFDLSYLTHLPNMSVFAPNTTEELKDILEYTKSLNSPVAIRYPKNSVSGITLPPLKDGLWTTVKDGDGAAVICVGPRMLKLALDAANDDTLIISARSIKPLCEKTLKKLKVRKIIVLEENSVIGGFGAQILSFYSQQGVSADVTCLGIKDSFVPHGDVDYQLELNGLTVENVSKIIKGNA